MKRSGTVLVRSGTNSKPFAKRSKTISGGFIKNPINKREIKRVYEEVTGAAASSVIEEFGDVASGDTSGTRDGRAIRQLYSDVIVVNKGSASGSVQPSLRVLIIQWKNALTVPAVSNILTSANGNSGYNINYEGTFKVLSDRIVSGEPGNQVVKYRVKHDFTQTYYSTAVANTADSQLYVILIQPDATQLVTTQTVGISTSYYDI